MFTFLHMKNLKWKYYEHIFEKKREKSLSKERKKKMKMNICTKHVCMVCKRKMEKWFSFLHALQFFSLICDVDVIPVPSVLSCPSSSWHPVLHHHITAQQHIQPPRFFSPPLSCVHPSPATLISLTFLMLWKEIKSIFFYAFCSMLEPFMHLSLHVV